MDWSKANKIKIFLFVLAVAAGNILYAQTYSATDTVKVETVDSLTEIVEPPPVEADRIEFEKINATSLPVVQERKVPDSVLKKLQSDDDFWYANIEREKEKPETQPKDLTPGILSKSWFKNILWIALVTCFVAIAVWFLAVNKVHIFHKKPAAIQEEDALLEENIFELPFESEITKAIAVANYRLAVRLLYLQTLKKLDNASLINYQHEKTNHDYLQELKDTPLFKNFAQLTRHFDYIWYGQFSVSKKVFQYVHQDFISFYQNLSA